MKKLKDLTSSPKFVFGLVWIVTIAFFVLGWGRYAMNVKNRVTQLENSKAVTALKSEDLQARLVASRARAKVVHFWATWCEPCARELPIYIDVQKKFSGLNTDFFVISADSVGDKAEVETFLADKKIHFPSYLIEGDQTAFIKALSPAWNGALPATFIFTSSGKLSSMTLGETTATELQTKIQTALADK